MKVLWLTNCPPNYISDISQNGYNGVGWVSASINYISNIKEIELAVGFVMSDQKFKMNKNNITYYPIPNPVQGSIPKKINKLFRYVINCGIKKFEFNIEEYYKNYFLKIINDFKPDIIHVWGSEKYLGLISMVTRIPTVIHIQGIINSCLCSFMPPGISWNNWIMNTCNPYEILMRRMEKNIWIANADREKRILNNIKFVMGRTEWDYRLSKIYSPKASYLQSNEMLRDVFYKDKKRVFPKKLTIISTISNAPYKGYDMILKTANILKNEISNDFIWKCYGDIKPKFIEKAIGIKHEDVNVSIMGVASAEQLYDSLICSTVYVHPSYIDNSPNSVCEAQALGIPIIASNVGGLSSIVRDKIDGFLIPSNDPYQAAYCITEMFINKEKNLVFGENGKKQAYIRHNREYIIKELLDNYNIIIKQNI